MERIRSINVILMFFTLLLILPLAGYSLWDEFEWEIREWLFPDDEKSPRSLSKGETRDPESGNLLRTHKLSYDSLVELSKEQGWWIVPMEQVGLKVSEDLSTAERVSRSHRPGDVDEIIVTASKRTRGPEYTSYTNNLIVYNWNTTEAFEVFETRAAIFKYLPIETTQHLGIVIECARRDTNSDNLLTGEDDRELIYYDVISRSLHKITFEGRLRRLLGHSDWQEAVLFTTATDIDGDGDIDPSREPFQLHRINLDNFIAEPILSPQLMTKLQSVIDGAE